MCIRDSSGLWAAQGKFINIIDTSYIYEENYVRKILGGFSLQPDISIAYAVEKSKEGDGKLANSIIFKAAEILPVSYTHLDVYKRQH